LGVLSSLKEKREKRRVAEKKRKKRVITTVVITHTVIRKIGKLIIYTEDRHRS